MRRVFVDEFNQFSKKFLVSKHYTIPKLRLSINPNYRNFSSFFFKCYQSYFSIFLSSENILREFFSHTYKASFYIRSFSCLAWAQKTESNHSGFYPRLRSTSVRVEAQRLRVSLRRVWAKKKELKERGALRYVERVEIDYTGLNVKPLFTHGIPATFVPRPFLYIVHLRTSASKLGTICMLSCQGICGQTRKCKRAVCVSNRARVSRYRSTRRHFSSCDLIRIKKLKPFFLKLILFRKINFHMNKYILSIHSF